VFDEAGAQGDDFGRLSLLHLMRALKFMSQFARIQIFPDVG
jgi:hypothetical protein